MRKRSKYLAYLMDADFLIDVAKHESAQGFIERYGATFEHLLYGIRNDHGLTLQEMADLFGVHKSTMSRLELGEFKRNFKYYLTFWELYQNGAFERAGREKRERKAKIKREDNAAATFKPKECDAGMTRSGAES